jgi:hypothetical protein
MQGYRGELNGDSLRGVLEGAEFWYVASALRHFERPTNTFDESNYNCPAIIHPQVFFFHNI